ncbi:unnamed protein product [Gordionus sp. m RMFG-2023]
MKFEQVKQSENEKLFKKLQKIRKYDIQLLQDMASIKEIIAEIKPLLENDYNKTPILIDTNIPLYPEKLNYSTNFKENAKITQILINEKLTSDITWC